MSIRSSILHDISAVKSWVILFAMFFGLAAGTNSLMAASTAPLTTLTKPANDAEHIISEEDPKFGDWYILGPLQMNTTDGDPNEETQKAFFEKQILKAANLEPVRKGNSIEYEGVKIKWKTLEVENGRVDLHSIYDVEIDYAAVYVYTEITADSDRKLLLGVGSDDGMRIWVNGESVYDFWGGRPMIPDEDLVSVDLKKGVNRILLKVQDMQYDWGFSVRRMTSSRLTSKLIDASRRGDLDMIRELIALGADPNEVDSRGLRPYQAALIKGRSDAAVLLVSLGADKNLPLVEPNALADAFMSEVANERSPGFSALVARNGKIIYTTAQGMANIKKGFAIDTSSIFRIGSVTKQFTAAAILKLQETGKLSLEDKLSKYFEGFEQGDNITVKHLLNHTSGLHSYTDDVNYEDKQISEAITTDQLVQIIRDGGQDFEPGTQWVYCNSGYYLLALIVEKVSGNTYDDFLASRFFDPLGMHNTGVLHPDSRPEKLVKGYSWEDGKFEYALDWNMDWAGGAGAIYSTVGDLYLWNEAVFSHQILSEKSIKAAHTPALLADGSQADAFGSTYGYGWMMNKFRGTDEVHHSGGLHGFVSHLTHFPELDLTVTVLANAMPSPDVTPIMICHNLAEVFAWEDLEEQKSFETKDLTDVDLNQYTGRYSYPGGAVNTITTSDGKLFAQLTGQGAFEIFAGGEDEFFWKVVDARVKFTRNDQGIITGLTHYQGGSEMIAPLIEEEESIELTEAQLDALTGTYLLLGQEFVVTRIGTILMAKFGDQEAEQIYARSPTEFYTLTVVATITFDLDDAGIAQRLTLDQGGRQFEAEKKK